MMIVPVLLATLAAAPTTSGCAAGLRPEIDPLSFASRDAGPPPTREALEKLRKSADAAFKKAADALCQIGQVDAQAFAPFRRLLIQSGSGASETAIYVDPERPGALIFQWAFVEGKLALPEPADIEMGIACWADPENEECADRMP